MFFVRKDNIGTQLGAQKEFQAAQRRGISFFAEEKQETQSRVWHYLWPADQIEASIKASVPGDFQYYIWSQEVKEGELIGDPVISGYNTPARDDNDEDDTPLPGWEESAKARFAQVIGEESAEREDSSAQG